MPFVIPYPGRLTTPEVISAPSIFSGMDGKRYFPSPPLFDPHSSVGCKPIVGMDDIKGTYKIFCLKEVGDERATHFIDFINEVGL
jgi:hypothetical protein